MLREFVPGNDNSLAEQVFGQLEFGCLFVSFCGVFPGVGRYTSAEELCLVLCFIDIEPDLVTASF